MPQKTLRATIRASGRPEQADVGARLEVYKARDTQRNAEKKRERQTKRYSDRQTETDLL
jgi:hypothetical protein